jgi:diguanylate cyclase (GGDEF)-like protein
MAQVQAGTRTMVLLCVLAVGGMIGLTMLISRWLAGPIISLSQASRRIAQGDFSSPIPVPNIQELATLAASFGQMSQEIQQSRQQLEDYSRSLAQQVRDRTAALEAEIDRRAKAEADLQLANQELQSLAYIDGLTQIANRRQFDDCLHRSWHQLKRDRQPLALIFGDVDYFKKYNDTYGHQMGDECLRSVAAAIAAAARRPADLAARYGGEEFAIILPNTSLEGAIVVAEQIQQRLRSCELPHRSSAVSPYVTLSLGVTSLIPDDSLLPETLLIQADQALYQAKSQGRNQFASLVLNHVFSR